MSEPVKRYNMDINKFGNVEPYHSEHGQYVPFYDFARLEQELAKVKTDRAACWAQFKIMTRSCLDAEKERDAALAECERFRAVLEGAQYPNLDQLPWLTVDVCRTIGSTVAEMTIKLQQERDAALKQVEGLLAEIRAMQADPVTYARRLEHAKSTLQAKP